MGTRIGLVGLGLIVAAATSSAQAAPTLFTGYDVNNSGTPSLVSSPNADAARDAFIASAGTVSSNGFEAFDAGDAPPLALQFAGSAGVFSATLTGDGFVKEATRAAPTSTGEYAVEGSKYFRMNGGTFDVGFNFGSGINAFGFYAIDLENLPGVDISYLYTDNSVVSYNLAQTFGINKTASGSVFFVGLIDDQKTFQSVMFSGLTAPNDVLVFDQLLISSAVGAVPEPATWAQLILGFSIVGASMRHRSRLRKLAI